MTGLTFEVPLPPKALSPNTRTASARMYKSGAVERYRAEVAMLARVAARQQGWSAPKVARVSLRWCLKRGPIPDLDAYEPRDPDNALASFKNGIDGLKDAGVITGDTWQRLRIGALDWTREHGPCIQVLVEEVPTKQ